MQFRASKLVLSVDPIHWHFRLHSVDIFGVEEVGQGDQLGEVSPDMGEESPATVVNSSN